MSELTKYERRSLKRIHAWKHPERGLFGKVMEYINWPLNKAGDAILGAPYVGKTIEHAVAGTLDLLNDAAQWTVRPEAIYREYRNLGHKSIETQKDLTSLDLEDIDRTIGYLAVKYKAGSVVEGAGLGFFGLPALPADIVALLTWNLRAIGEFATYCGIDLNLTHERIFAFNVLGYASSPTDATKGLAMAQLTRIAVEVAKKRPFRELEKHAFVLIMQEIAKALGVRLTRAKLAAWIPVAGAFVGGGFNTYFTSKVCTTAYYLYRERFLAEKYGPDVIEVVGEPVSDATAGYEDAKEAG